MFNLFYIDYYFIFITIFILFVSFFSNRYDLCFKYRNLSNPINLYMLINLVKISLFFKILCIVLLNLNYNGSNSIVFEPKMNLVVCFKLVFFIFLFFYLQYFYHYSKLVLWNNFEFFYIFLISCFALSILPQTNNFIFFYVLLELYTFSICSSLVIKKLTKKLSESSFKYLILNGVSSCLILFGLSFVYFSTGLIDFNEINKVLYFVNKLYFIKTIHIGYLLILTGFFVKLVLFPFSVFISNIYYNIPNNFLFFILIFPKFVFLLVMYFITHNFFIISNFKYVYILLYCVVLTSFVHSFICLYTFNLKNLIINFSLSNSFFFLSPLFFKSIFFFPSFINYILIYFINLFCFFIFIFIFCSNYKFFIKKINNLVSVYYVNNVLAFLIVFNFLSLISIPPFYGFFVKFYIFYFILEYKFYTLYFILSFINLILVYVFLRIIRILFLKKSNSYIKAIIIKKNFLAFLVVFFTLINCLSIFLFDFIYMICFLISNSSILF